MIRGGAVIVAVACGMMVPCSMPGQAAGERLRVTFGANWVEGEAVRVFPGQLELAVAGGLSRVFAADVITMVERLVRKSQGKRGFVIGGSVGWVVGGLFVAAAAKALESELTSTADMFMYFGVGGFLIGLPCGLVGAIIGSMIELERWETVPGWGQAGASPGLLLGLQPGPRGGKSLRVGGRLRF